MEKIHHQDLKDIIKSIKEKNYITIEEFNELKYYSIQPGGFSQKNKKSNENQKIIIKALLNMMETQEEINFIKNIKKHPSKKISNNFKDIDSINNSQEIDVVNKDLPRNIFYKWKENNKDLNYDLNEFGKEIENFLKENKNKYSYYQGYLDFSIFFYVLFKEKNDTENKNIYINAIQFFTEIFLKDYISPYKALGITEDIIFKNSLNLLIDIIKLFDKNIYEIFKEDCTPLSLILSWVISLFSHSINDFFILRRVLDYLLINEPINSYILTAFILIKSIKENIKNISEAESEDFFIVINNINLDQIDFDDIIIKCDEFIYDNLEEILEIQNKNKNHLLLLGDFNFRGIENLVYTYNNEILEERYIRKKSWIISYQFIFILFLIWIFVIYFFHKDSILEKIGDRGNKLEAKTNSNLIENDDDL